MTTQQHPQHKKHVTKPESTAHEPTIVAPQHAEPTPLDIPYENNPFLIVINGVRELFTKAQAIAIIIIVLTALGFLGNMLNVTLSAIDSGRNERTTQTQSTVTDDTTRATTSSSSTVVPSTTTTPSIDTIKESFHKITPAQWALITIILIIVIVIWTIGALIGVYTRAVLDYTTAHVALGETVGFGQALSGGLHGYFPYLWIQIIVGFKTFLWSLPFIIPGFIMSIRYSLAGTSYYATGKRGGAAIRDSLALTKGAWLTTYASYAGLNILTGGVAETLLATGSKVILYRQLSAYQTANKQKPAAHVLSWLTLILPIIFVVLAWLILALIVIAVLNMFRNGF